MDKLPKNKSKKIKKLDLLVIRLGADGSLKMSKPCSKCLDLLNKSKKMRGYKVVDVYYSNETGGITKDRFSTLYENTDYKSKSFRPTDTYDRRKVLKGRS